MEQGSYPEGITAAQLHCKRDDRRAQPRLRCKGVAELIVLALGRRMAGTLLDLSARGCCIRTDAPLPALESPVVEVQLSVDGTTLRVAGVVRNLRGERRAGIEFTDVTARKAKQINELVTELVERNRECRDETEAGSQPAVP